MKDDIRWIRTHCARMDHGGCAIFAGVRDNRIVKIKADPEGYLNRGYVCVKGLYSAEKLGHPERLKHPLKRKGKRGDGKWERISWSEALDILCGNLGEIREKYGARSVAFCQGMPKGLEHFVLIRLANTFGSPNIVATQDVCHAPREVSGLHTCGFYPVADFHHKSRLTMVWGSNVTSTNEEGEICSLLLKQVKEGTELIVVDPRKTDLAEKARYWLQLRPGTDNALALAFLNVIINEGLFDTGFVEKWTNGFDELATHVAQFTPEFVSDITWVDPQLIRKSARFYAENRPASIQWGNTIEHNIHTFDTSRALICLMAICGNLDVPGGNIKANEPALTGLGKFVRADLLPSKREEMLSAYHHVIPRLMTVPPAFFRKAVLEQWPYPVKGAYMQCTNPMLAYADSPQTYDALNKLDFFAVTDIFMTPTACLADLVLPAATQFEFNDVGHLGLGHGILLARPKVVEPPGECWPDIKILNEMGKRLTPKEYWFEDYESLAGVLLGPSGLSYEQFVEKGFLTGEARFRKYESKGFKTPTGKVELFLSKAEKYGLSPMPLYSGLPEQDDPDYPLVLTSSKSPYYLHSSYRWVEKLRRLSDQPEVEIHPDTASGLGISQGDQVVIETKQGALTQTARLTSRIHPRVVNASYGWWFPEAGADDQFGWKRSNFNMLTTTKRLGREFGTPNLKGIGCRIRPCE